MLMLVIGMLIVCESGFRRILTELMWKLTEYGQRLPLNFQYRRHLKQDMVILLLPGCMI